MDLAIIPYEEYKPSTITIIGSFNISIETKNVAQWIHIKNIFDENGKRKKLISGSRESIEYFGKEGAIVSICSQKDLRRGMRTGAMNNMISADMQYNNRNIHLKISGSSITSVGTNSLEEGEQVFKKMTEHIANLKIMLDQINLIDSEEKVKNIEWLKNNLSEGERANTIPNILTKIRKSSDDINKYFLNFCALYIEDFDDMDKYIEKLYLLTEPIIICNDKLECNNFNIYNSVYHITPNKKKNFRMPLHRLAPFLYQKGIEVEYHNWVSEGVNICFDIEEKKTKLAHCDKEYRHRFSIQESSKIRQFSPTKKEEAYKYYLKVMDLLKEFFEHPEIDFSKFVCVSLEEKKILESYLDVKGKTKKNK